MNTELTKQDHLMIITVVAGLILAAVAFLIPIQAEAGLVVRAQIGSVGVAVATDSPRGAIVQTGPRTYRCDIPTRPRPRPLRGHFVWVPGHYEKVLETRNCRQNHYKNGKYKPGKGKFKRTKLDHLVKGKGGRRAHRHNHYREIWVTGHWERV
jgi:hypothetical protein